jgi:hypothetical protein
MRTPDDVFSDFAQRRNGIVRALTTDVDRLFQLSDPDRENLCLYGHSDGSWEVDLPAEEVPPEVPEPALGINFARDGMQKRDWLALVAVHSDCWLLAVAFYNGARLNKEGRDRLFELINELPTCYEIVSGKAPTNAGSKNPRKRSAPPPVRPTAAGRQPKPVQRLNGKHEDDDDDYEDEDEDEEEEAAAVGGEAYGDGDGDPCPNCGRQYRVGEFWIACDFCDTWYDGKCVQMTPGKAQRMGKWKCPQCLRNGV